MCIRCDIYAATRDKMLPQVAIHAVAMSHRNVLAQQLEANPHTAAALFGEIPEGGCSVEMVLNGDTATGTQTLDVRIPDGDKGLRVTYSTVDYTACVNYTGNGPEGKSVIGADAILAALEYISSKETGLEAMATLGVLKAIPGVDVQDELARTQLVKRCLTALREITEKNSSAE